MAKIENGIGIVKSVHLSAGEYILPGYTHVLVEEVDFMNDVYSIKLIDDDLESIDDLEWIVQHCEAVRQSASHNKNPGEIPGSYFFLVSSHIYFPSTITVDSVNHTYTGTLSSSTYSGYKLAANSNKIVSAGDHTLSGYTGNNITLAISDNTVSVKNTKTSTNRTTELQNFIKNELKTNDYRYTLLQTVTIDNDGKSCPVYAHTTRSSMTKPIIYINATRILYRSGYELIESYVRLGYDGGWRLIWNLWGKEYWLTIWKLENDYTIATYTGVIIVG